MADISKEMAVRLAREAFEQLADSIGPKYWRTTAWARDAWPTFLAAYKLGRNAGLDEAANVVWNAETPDCGGWTASGIAESIESLKDNTP